MGCQKSGVMATVVRSSKDLLKLQREKKKQASRQPYRKFRDNGGKTVKITRKKYYQSRKFFYVIHLIFAKITSVHIFMIICILNCSPA